MRKNDYTNIIQALETATMTITANPLYKDVTVSYDKDMDVFIVKGLPYGDEVWCYPEATDGYETGREVARLFFDRINR